MAVEITHAGDRDTLKDALENMFPNHTPEDIAKAAGAIDGSHVQLHAVDHNHIGVYHSHPHLEGFRNFQKIYPPGKPSQIVLTHESQTARGPLLGKGYQRFKEQIKRLQGMGVGRIVIGTGAGSKGAGENGYITWPKVGFQGDLNEDQISKLPPEIQAKLNEPGKNNFHTLFSIPGAAKLWEEVGTPTGRLHFDLTPGSEHLKRFENYYADRERRESAKQPTAEGISGTQQPGTSTGSGASEGSHGMAGGVNPSEETTRTDQRISRGMRGIKKLARIREMLLQYKRSKFCCTMIPIEGEAADKLKAMGDSIPDEDLGEDGRETDPHITVLYGLHDSNPTKVNKLLSRVQRPIKFNLGKVSLFSGEESGKDYDVVKVEVISPDLHKLNKLLKTLPHTDNWPEYKPHATIAYVKKGLGKKYEEQFGDINLSGTADKVIFSDRDKRHTIIPIANKKITMSRTEQPLKFELTPPIHPLIKGFRIAHALKAIVKSPEASDTSKKLALDVLHNGNTSALWPLNDSLKEDKHPLAHKEDEKGKLVSGYNWTGAVHKLHLDSAVGKVLDAVQKRLEKESGLDSVPARSLAHTYARMALKGSSRDFLPGGGFVDPGANGAVLEGMGILKDQGHSPEELQDSLNRHGVRDKDLGITPTLTKTTPEDVRTKAITPEAPTHALDRATRFKRLREVLKFGRTPQIPRGDFLAALKRVQSQQQNQLHTIAKDIFSKLNLNPLTVRDAIADSPTHSSANAAMAVEHESDPEKAKYAAAMYGLVSQSPALLLFHVHPEGKDTVWKIPVQGSADKARQTLDKMGLTQRTFLPHSTGYQVLIPDPGTQLGDRVQQFAQSQGVKVSSSKGTGEILGGGENSSADSDSRRQYRKIIRGFEAKQGNQSGQLSQPVPASPQGSSPVPTGTASSNGYSP